MASSSVSQEDINVNLVTSSWKRSKIRSARARTFNCARHDEEGNASDADESGGAMGGSLDHDLSPKQSIRVKEKRLNRPSHMNKGKLTRDRRKLREKRRSTGVVTAPSNESTGGSSLEEDPLSPTNVEGRHRNEFTCTSGQAKLCTRNKSASDLEADDEDNNQDGDSLCMSDSIVSVVRVGGVAGGILSPDHEDESYGGIKLTKNDFSCREVEELQKTRHENLLLREALQERELRIATLEAKISQMALQLTQLKPIAD